MKYILKMIIFLPILKIILRLNELKIFNLVHCSCIKIEVYFKNNYFRPPLLKRYCVSMSEEKLK